MTSLYKLYDKTDEEVKQERLIESLGYEGCAKTNRIEIDEAMMQVAISVSKRSPDAQTKVGCVIISPDKRILSTGYNGFPRNIDYSNLPNTRPDKYPWFLHAEMNAIAWCEIRPVDCTLYCTHECCNSCLFHAWQNGITHAVEGSQKSHMKTHANTKELLIRELFLSKTGMKITKIDISHLLTGV